MDQQHMNLIVKSKGTVQDLCIARKDIQLTNNERKKNGKGIRGLERCANSSHRCVERNLLERASHLATWEPAKISTFLP